MFTFNIENLNTRSFNMRIGMIRRCYCTDDQSYQGVGSVGIRVCARWHSYETFCDDMGEKPVDMRLNRKSKKRNFTPSNCEWFPLTPKQIVQHSKKRKEEGRTLVRTERREVKLPSIRLASLEVPRSERKEHKA